MRGVGSNESDVFGFCLFAIWMHWLKKLYTHCGFESSSFSCLGCWLVCVQLRVVC